MNKFLSLHLVTATGVAALILSFAPLVDFDAAPPAPVTAAIDSALPAAVETTSTAKPAPSGRRLHPSRPANV